MIVFKHFSRLALADDSAAFKDVGALDQRQDGVHVLLDDQQAHAVAM
jgi:hypothetical protein